MLLLLLIISIIAAITITTLYSTEIYMWFLSIYLFLTALLMYN